MGYDSAAAKSLPSPSMPAPSAWLGSLGRFAEHIQTLVQERRQAGLLDSYGEDEFETTLEVAAPLNATQLAELRKELPYELPQPLAEFFLHWSSKIDFSFAIDLGNDGPADGKSWIQGGSLGVDPDPLFAADMLLDYVTDARDYAEYSGMAEFPEDQAIWLRTIPFHRFNNADFLALDPVDDPQDPYVVHLDHEGEPRLVARNFASFLIEWSRICYVGPGDIYELESYLDPTTSVLSGDLVAAQSLRDALKWSSS